MGERSYRRVLLKLSGEALGHPDNGQGIDSEAVSKLASQLARVSRMGVELALVCGGGNILRGANFRSSGMHRASARRVRVRLNYLGIADPR